MAITLQVLSKLVFLITWSPMWVSWDCKENFDTHQTRITLDDWQPAQTDTNQDKNHHTANNDSFSLVGLKQREQSNVRTFNTIFSKGNFLVFLLTSSNFFTILCHCDIIILAAYICALFVSSLMRPWSVVSSWSVQSIKAPLHRRFKIVAATWCNFCRA